MKKSALGLAKVSTLLAFLAVNGCREASPVYPDPNEVCKNTYQTGIPVYAYGGKDKAFFVTCSAIVPNEGRKVEGNTDVCTELKRVYALGQTWLNTRSKDYTEDNPVVRDTRTNNNKIESAITEFCSAP
jgi:hypothetical protein